MPERNIKNEDSIGSERAALLLTAGEMSYALELDAEDHPVNLYWGGKLERMEDLPSLDDRRRNRHRSPRQSDMVCQEYPAFYGEFYDECALKITWPDGIRADTLPLPGRSSGRKIV